MDSVSFRFSTPQDEPTLKKVIEDSWMIEKDFHLGNTFKKSPLSKALSEDRGTPVQLIVFDDVKTGIHGLASLAQWSNNDAAKMGLMLKTRDLKVGYLADLRMSASASREMRLSWRVCYRELIEGLAGQILLTSVLDENTLARKSLCSGRGGIFYTPLLSYATFTLFNPPASKFTESRRLLEPRTVKAEYRTGFNRVWQLKTPSSIQQLNPVIVSGLGGVTVPANTPIDANDQVHYNPEAEIENCLHEIWVSENQEGPYAIQLAVPSGLISKFAEIFRSWNKLVTPATLYQVTTEKSAPDIHWQVTDRQVLDVSVL